MTLIDLRRLLRNDVDTHKKLRSGALMKLTPEIAIDRREYLAMTPWDIAETRARAFGMAADKMALCSLSAARILGIEVLSNNNTVEMAYVGEGRPRGRSTWPQGVIHRSGLIRPEEVARVDGILVTGSGRTCLDIARFHGIDEGVVAMDHALRTNSNVTKAALQERAEVLAKYPGIADARTAIDLATGRAQTVLETMARLRMLESPLVSTVEEQVQFTLPNGEDVWVDQRINGKLIVELDGEWKYDGSFGKPTAEVLRKEKRRENSLRQMGHTVLRFTFEEVKNGIMRQQVEEYLRREGAWSA